MNLEQLKTLLQADESDTLERKASLSDPDAIRDTLIQFANDLAGRGGGQLIIGQAPDKTIQGLKISDDEAQQKIAAIARDKCRPGIPIYPECHAIGTVRVPHCRHQGKRGAPSLYWQLLRSSGQHEAGCHRC